MIKPISLSKTTVVHNVQQKLVQSKKHIISPLEQVAKKATESVLPILEQPLFCYYETKKEALGRKIAEETLKYKKTVTDKLLKSKAELEKYDIDFNERYVDRNGNLSQAGHNAINKAIKKQEELNKSKKGVNFRGQDSSFEQEMNSDVTLETEVNVQPEFYEIEEVELPEELSEIFYSNETIEMLAHDYDFISHLGDMNANLASGEEIGDIFDKILDKIV